MRIQPHVAQYLSSQQVSVRQLLEYCIYCLRYREIVSPNIKPPTKLDFEVADEITKQLRRLERKYGKL